MSVQSRVRHGYFLHTMVHIFYPVDDVVDPSKPRSLRLALALICATVEF
jgi:hypothetical protein